MIKKRNLFLAGIFNFYSPGLGFLYVGKLTYAIVFPLLLVLFLGVSSWSGLIFEPTGFAVLVTLGLALWISGAVIASYTAYRQGEVKLARFQRWYIYIGFIVLSSIMGGILMENRSAMFGYEAFRLPSGSMMDTLMPGDFVISDTRKYRKQSPNRGELVVFLHPKDPADKYLKRIIGVPGDYVEIQNGKVSINGEVLDEEYVKDRYNQKQSLEISESVRIPDNAYFVLGDNRDNSNDSRYWGFVPADNIAGSVEHIWFSYVPEYGIRSERIGLVFN